MQVRDRRRNQFYNFFTNCLDYMLSSSEEIQRNIETNFPQVAEFVNRCVVEAYAKRHCRHLQEIKARMLSGDRSVGNKEKVIVVEGINSGLRDKSWSSLRRGLLLDGLLLDSWTAVRDIDRSWDSVLQYVLENSKMPKTNDSAGTYFARRRSIERRLVRSLVKQMKRRN